MRRIYAFCAAIIVLLCSCNEARSDTEGIIKAVSESFSDCLPSTLFYTSKTEEGEDGYFDPGLVGAMLGDDGSVPRQISGCAEISFLCSNTLSVCEVWAVECYTYEGAREVLSVFEKRKKLLSSIEFENEADAKASTCAQVTRRGRYVFFAACGKSEDVMSFMLSLL